MRKLTALLMVCMLCLTMTAYAAEWAEGLSPAKPYAGVMEVELTETMGYIMLYPRAKMPVSAFCDVLEIYLPREDVVLGEGKLTLYDEDGSVEEIAFNDPEAVEIRPLEESELDALMWGSGVCLEIHLTSSLRLDKKYHVLMEEGCFTAADGSALSPAITNPEAWTPMIDTDYGVSGMFYSVPVEKTVKDEVSGDDKVVLEPGEPKKDPQAGDLLSFDLVIGEGIETAVLFSENGTVAFDVPEYQESATVNALITGDPYNWGVVFLDDAGEVVDVVELGTIPEFGADEAAEEAVDEEAAEETEAVEEAEEVEEAETAENAG